MLPKIVVQTVEVNNNIDIKVDYTSHIRYLGNNQSEAVVELTSVDEIDQYVDQLEFVTAKLKEARARVTLLQPPHLATAEQPEKNSGTTK